MAVGTQQRLVVEKRGWLRVIKKQGEEKAQTRLHNKDLSQNGNGLYIYMEDIYIYIHRDIKVQDDCCEILWLDTLASYA